MALKKLLPYHKSLCIHLAKGMNPDDIADALGIAKQTVYNLRHDPLIEQEVNKWCEKFAKQALDENAKIEKMLNKTKIKAIEKLTVLMDGAKSEETQRRASLDVLNLGGFNPPKKIEIEQKTPHLIIIDEHFRGIPQGMTSDEAQTLGYLEEGDDVNAITEGHKQEGH